MADELVNAGKSPLAEPGAASTSLVPRSVFANEAMLAEALAHNTRLNQREGGASKIRAWWKLIARHKLMILALMLVIVPFSAIQAYRPKPYYEAVATIEVQEEPTLMMSAKHGEYWYNSDNTKSETYILQSRPVLERATVNLQLDRNPLFLGSGKRRSVWEALRALSGADVEQSKKTLPGAALPQPAQADASKLDQAMFDPAYVKTAAEREKLAPYVATLSSGLKVEGVRDTRLLKIFYTHSDPDIAAQVANGIATSFIDHNYETKTKRFTTTSGWLEEATRKLKAQVEQAEQKLADYSRTHNIFSTDGKEDLATNKLADMHTQVMKVETDRILRESLYEQVQQGAINQLPEAFADPKTAELRKELNELAVNAAQLSVRFGPKHPRLVEIRQQMAVIQEQIDANRTLLADKLKADYERAVREEQSLKAALDKAKTEASKQNQSNIQFGILQKDLETAKAIHTEFLNKTSQANIQKAEQFNNVRMVETAEPPGGPKGPRRSTLILAGLLSSLMLGVGLAWLLENLNTSIRNMEDVTRATSLPTLAVIPTLEQSALGVAKTHKTDTGLLEGADAAANALLPPADLAHSFLTDEYSTAAEAYRMLRTSVMLSTAGHPPRTILITSGQPGDGKTTTVFNTAIAFTQLDAEVLIIDCDMRKPRMHKVAQIEKGKGLSNFLSSGSGLDELIRPTGIPHLSIMSSGPIPPNPSELISSGKMKELLARLLERFDYILIDSPPVVTVTDPMILSTLVDGVILVAKSGQTKTEVLRRAYQDLSTVGAKVLGVILNDYNLQRENYDYYYYYRYSYDYTESARNGGGAD